MDNYANKNLNLSDFRGMNQQDFAHSSDEAARLINFKPTGAGLEMRNGARTLMEGAINGKIVGEGSRAMMTSDGYVIQKVTDDDGVVTLVNTGYQPFGALDNCFGTEYKNVFVITPTGDDKSYVATLDENMVVLFDNTPIDENGADQSMAVWNYNWNLKSMLGCGMGIGSHDVHEIDGYLLDGITNLEPNSQSVYDSLNTSTGVSTSENIYKISSDIYEKSVNRKNTFSHLAITGSSYASWVIGDNIPLTYIDSSGYIQMTSGLSFGTLSTETFQKVKVLRCIDDGDFAHNFTICMDSSGNIGFLYRYDVGPIFRTSVEYSLSGTDFGVITDGNAYGSGDFADTNFVFAVRYSGGRYHVDVLKLSVTGGPSDWESGSMTMSITLHQSSIISTTSFSKIATPISGIIREQKSYGYFVLYNDSEIQKVNFEFRDGEFVNVELGDKINSSAFPFVTGGIKDICIQTSPFYQPINYHNAVGIRPYFGDSEVSGGKFEPTFVNSELISTEYQGTGKLTWSASGTTITGKAGTSTVFTSEARVGDFIAAVISAGTYETRQIVSITDNDTLDVDIAFSSSAETTGVDFYVYPSSDMYVQPVLGSEYAVPINVGDGTKFNANVPDATSAKVWQYWLFYIIPSPTLDNSVESLRLLRGSWGDKGFYEVSAYGDESDGDGGYIATEFANYWGTNSVLAFEVGGGSSDMNVFNCKDGYEDDFKKFLGANTTGMTCTISTITSGSETSDEDDDYSVAKAYFTARTSGSGSADCGVASSFSFELTAGEQYWLSFTAATDVSLGAVCDFFIYTNQNNKDYISLKKVNQTLPAISSPSGFTNYGFLFKCIKSGRHTFRIDTDTATAHTLYFGNVSLSLYSAFPNQSALAWKSFEDEKFIVQDYKFGGTWDAYLDKSAQALYFTEKSMCYANKGQSIAYPTDVIVCGFNSTGLFLATLNEVYVVTGTSFDSIANTKILDYGLPDENYYGFDISVFGAVVFNEEGLFYLNSDTYADNAGANLSDKILEYLPLANSDSDHRTICFDPINKTIVAQGKDNLNGNALTIGDVVLGMWLAIYDLVEKSWHLYAYNAEEPAKSYCQFLKSVNRVVVNMGDTTTPATSASVRVMEESNDTAREDYGFLNEAWDFMIGNFLTRSMSFDYPMNVKRLTRTQYLINTLRPFDDVAQYDWVRGAFYEQYAPHSADSDQRIVAEFETDTFDVDYPNTEDDLMMSFLEQMNCKFLVGAMDLWIGRLQDTENPKALLVSAIYRIEYSYREKRGGF